MTDEFCKMLTDQTIQDAERSVELLAENGALKVELSEAQQREATAVELLEEAQNRFLEAERGELALVTGFNHDKQLWEAELAKAKEQIRQFQNLLAIAADDALRFQGERDEATAAVKMLEEQIGRRGEIAKRYCDAIRKHRDTPGDDRCWMDDYDLYHVLPEGFVPPQSQNEPAAMLESCKRFIQQRSMPGVMWETEQERIDRAVQAERERCDSIVGERATVTQDDRLRAALVVISDKIREGT